MNKFLMMSAAAVAATTGMVGAASAHNASTNTVYFTAAFSTTSGGTFHETFCNFFKIHGGQYPGVYTDVDNETQVCGYSFNALGMGTEGKVNGQKSIMLSDDTSNLFGANLANSFSIQYPLVTSPAVHGRKAKNNWQGWVSYSGTTSFVYLAGEYHPGSPPHHAGKKLPSLRSALLKVAANHQK